MKKEGLPEEILHSDGVLDACSRKIDANIINPVNAENIKKYFREKNHQFEYSGTPYLSKMRRELKALRFPKSIEGKLLQKKRAYLINKTSMIEHIGSPKFSLFSKRIHPLPRKAELQRAQELLEQKNGAQQKKMRLIDAYKELQECFTQLDMPWHVQKIPMVAGASVMPSQRVLYLKKKTLFSQSFIQRLKVHEIGTHAVRAENGRLQPLSIFLHGLADYLPTEEGLAAYNEEQFGLLDATVLRTYAGRLVAVDLARKHSFNELVEELGNYFSAKKAITLALRAKRGVAHGSEKGGYTKDAAYLVGYWALKDYEAKGGDFAPLYYGKVGLKDLPALEKLDWLVQPKYHPDMLRKNKSARNASLRHI